MTRTSPPQVAFSSGELDPLLHRRFDYQKFQTGLAKCRGFMPLTQGGFTRAPGTFYLGQTRTGAKAKLIPFQFAANDAVVLEFTNLRMRVWRYGTLVMDGGSPYELVTPYDLAALDRLKWVQSADVIRLVDGVLPMQRLARQALDNWSIVAETFNKGPFRAQNLTKSKTIQANGDTGTVTLTASFSFFTTAHEGSLLEFRPSDNTDVALWTSNTSPAVGGLRRYGRNTYELTSTGTTIGNNPPQHTEGSQRVDNDGPVIWKHRSSDVGIVRIISRTSATVATAQVIEAIPRGCVTEPTYRWSEGAWSAIYGYPSSIELYDQRLVAAGTPFDPRTAWFSVVGDFRDFSLGVAADEGFAYSVSGDSSVNAILNLKRGKTGLHIFALGEEYSSRSETRGQVIGPTTAIFSHNSSQGASSARPVVVDGNPIFITRDGRRVVEIMYSFEQDANVAQVLSAPAAHLGNEPFQEIVWQDAPQPTAWMRRPSEGLAMMVYDRAEEVLGWAVVTLAGGVVESMAVTNDATGTKDLLTMIVRRVVNGNTVRHVEEQAVNYAVLTGDDPITDANHLFAARKFAPGVPTQSFSLDHLAGSTNVYAWTDQGSFGPFTMPLVGPLDIGAEVSLAVIGLFDTTHFVETLDIVAAAQDGNSMGRQKRLHGAGIGLHRTVQGQVAAVEYELGRAERATKGMDLISRQVAADMTAAFSGVVAAPVPSGHAKELALRFYPVGGAPMTITAIIPTVQEAGR